MLSNIGRLVLETYSVALNCEACGHCILLGTVHQRLGSVWKRAKEAGKGSRGSVSAAVGTFCDVKRLILKRCFGGTDTWMLHKNAQLFQRAQVEEFSSE
jgi:L-lactate utilization protein LutB